MDLTINGIYKSHLCECLFKLKKVYDNDCHLTSINSPCLHFSYTLIDGFLVYPFSLNSFKYNFKQITLNRKSHLPEWW